MITTDQHTRHARRRRRRGSERESERGRGREGEREGQQARLLSRRCSMTELAAVQHGGLGATVRPDMVVGSCRHAQQPMSGTEVSSPCPVLRTAAHV
eukprot:1638848-Rhodomonas_salina.1